MQLSLTTLALAFAGLVAGRELSVLRKDPKQVVIQSKGDGNTLWFTMSISNGIPLFEIKGSEVEKESSAKAKVQLAMSNVHELDSSASYNLQGTQAYWGDIGVEQASEKNPKRIILRSRMVHTDQDIAGNYFVIQLESVIDENASEFSIRPMIQNFPYARNGSGKGRLELVQVFATSVRVDSKQAGNGVIAMGPYGALEVIQGSAIEDGDPGHAMSAKVIDSKGTHPKSFFDCKSEKLTEVEFHTTRPKNATFVEKLTFNPQTLKLSIPEKVIGSSEKDKIKGLSINAAYSSAGSKLVGAAAAIMAAIVGQF